MVHGKAAVIIFRVVRWPPAAGADWAKIPKGAAVTQIKPPSPVGGHKIWICGTKKRENKTAAQKVTESARLKVLQL